MHYGFVRTTRQNDMLELTGLFLQRRVYVWIGMAEKIDPPGTDGVYISLAVQVFQPYPLSTADG